MTNSFSKVIFASICFFLLAGCEPVTSTPPIPVPATPLNCTVVPGDTQVTFTWDLVPGADSYIVYYATTSGFQTAAGTKINCVTNTFHLQNISNGTSYYFVVTAQNSSGESSPSVEIQAQPTAVVVLPTPANLAGTWEFSGSGGTRTSYSGSVITSTSIYSGVSSYAFNLDGTYLKNSTMTDVRTTYLPEGNTTETLLTYASDKGTYSVSEDLLTLVSTEFRDTTSIPFVDDTSGWQVRTKANTNTAITILYDGKMYTGIYNPYMPVLKSDIPNNSLVGTWSSYAYFDSEWSTMYTKQTATFQDNGTFTSERFNSPTLPFTTASSSQNYTYSVSNDTITSGTNKMYFKIFGQNYLMLSPDQTFGGIKK